MIFTEKDRSRFYKKVRVTPGCWVWTAHKGAQGYGVFRVGRKLLRAHRVSYLMNVGENPTNLFVCHKCDNPSCVNPDHLFLGTNKENCDDRDSKGRNINYKGSDHGSAKLTDDQVFQIYFMPGKQRDIARIFDVHQGTVYHIKRGKTWRHLDFKNHPLALIATAAKLHPKVKA